MPAGAVLIHGVSGSPEDLGPLESPLRRLLGGGAVANVALPGHPAGSPPVFREEKCVAAVLQAVDAFQAAGREIVLIGHSTGGVLALAALAKRPFLPKLLVLAASPAKIGMDALDRWERHRTGREAVPFSAVSGLVLLTNRAGSRAYEGRFPVLVLHGEEDDLVPVAEAGAWSDGVFEGPVRTVIVSGAGHHLFRGQAGGMSVDIVTRSVRDASIDPSEEDADVARRVIAAEPEAEKFLHRSVFSRVHIARSASGMNVAGRAPELPERTTAEPVFANIEITTRCNLSCAYCARSFRQVAPEDMPLERFRSVLAHLPHAYRITLVGLGEPLLHPGLVDCVSLAAEQGRRVGLVTNALLLDDAAGTALLDAGLSSIAFSIDAADQAMAQKLRPGTDLERVIGNIKAFTEKARASERPVSTAVFTAVSTENIRGLDALVDLVAGLGVHVLMMTDLNFAENRERTLWKGGDDAAKMLLRQAVTRAFAKKLPVLSVHGLEEFGLMTRYDRFLLLPPDSLSQRSTKRTWCCSPWQTIPVNVRGEVTICDCQPDRELGNILTVPFTDIWNGDSMSDYRRRMLSDDPPAKCLLCPRF